jgi:hypothetical protein
MIASDDLGDTLRRKVQEEILQQKKQVHHGGTGARRK